MGGKIFINAEQVLTLCTLWLIITIIVEFCKNAMKEEKYGRTNKNNHYRR